jgi:hypothetical protein
MLNKKVDIVLDQSIDAYRMFPKDLNAEHDEKAIGWTRNFCWASRDLDRIASLVDRLGN